MQRKIFYDGNNQVGKKMQTETGKHDKSVKISSRAESNEIMTTEVEEFK